MIRGLDRETKISDIKEALTLLNYSPLKVNQMTNFKTKIPMSLFQIHLDDTENNRNIFEVNEFLYQWVIVEEYRRLTRTVLCYRCHHFHHTCQNCKLDSAATNVINRATSWTAPKAALKLIILPAATANRTDTRQITTVALNFQQT